MSYYAKAPQEYEYTATVHVTVSLEIALDGSYEQAESQLDDMSFGLQEVKHYGVEVVDYEVQHIEPA